MPYMLRFVQRFKQADRSEFLNLEAEFARLERDIPEFPKGKRYLPLVGREPGNTLIWECEFPSLQDLNQALELLKNDDRHEELFSVQSNFFLESWTEIYEAFEGQAVEVNE